MTIPLMQEDYNVNLGAAVEKDPVASYETGIALRFAQIPALEQLENTLEEIYNKVMVVMATGLGKTYLAAFFCAAF